MIRTTYSNNINKNIRKLYWNDSATIGHINIYINLCMHCYIHTHTYIQNGQQQHLHCVIVQIWYIISTSNRDLINREHWSYDTRKHTQTNWMPHVFSDTKNNNNKVLPPIDYVAHFFHLQTHTNTRTQRKNKNKKD